jgi:branched-chain amino acid transport system substrate-binding protein
LRRPLTIALVAATLPAAGCGQEESRGGKIRGDTLTVHSSLPLRGPWAGAARSIANAQALALEQAGGKAARLDIRFVSRDDTTLLEGEEPRWSAGRVADNASDAAEDSRTIAYIGDFDSGASANSIPITNEAGIAQVSPGATAVGLTKLVAGADKGEPDKFYPSGERSFARVIPADDVQASAALEWAKQLGARRVFAVDDKSVAGGGLAEQFRIAAERGGVEVVGRKGMDPRADEYRDVAEDVAKKRPDLVYFGGGVESNAVRFWQDLHAELPSALLMGAAGLLAPDFYGRIGDAAGKTYLVSAALDLRQLPPRGRRFVREYRRAYGVAPDAYAAYGHAAMSLVLDAIKRAGGRASERASVIDEILSTTNFESAVGRFSIDENGDTSLDRVAGYRVRGGELSFDRGLRGVAAR